jgi:UDP-N-acetylenolpyruvoylglucosamine reductase
MPKLFQQEHYFSYRKSILKSRNCLFIQIYILKFEFKYWNLNLKYWIVPTVTNFEFQQLDGH